MSKEIKLFLCLSYYYMMNGSVSAFLLYQNFVMPFLPLQIAPDWRQALSLKKAVEDRIAKGKLLLNLESQHRNIT